MTEPIANIGAVGVRRRRVGGYVWLVVGVAASVALVLTGAPRLTRLSLAIPFGLAALGLLQAREKT